MHFQKYYALLSKTNLTFTYCIYSQCYLVNSVCKTYSELDIDVSH